jgi:hypothetical protein
LPSALNCSTSLIEKPEAWACPDDMVVSSMPALSCRALQCLSLDWPLTQFGFFGHCGTSRGSFCVFGPVLSSPAHAARRRAASLDMPLRRIEVVFVLWDDLKLTSGLRTPTAFNGQNYFFKIGRSKVLDEHYNSYLKK